ncbi:MAG: heme-binding domain-containing protein [Spirosomataceae bacterium]|jgi:hypothetical protein
MKKILSILAVILIVIQFIKPERNLSDDNSNGVYTKYPASDEVKQILAVACNDCHSNKTTYPWYANLQPVAWWLDHHVTDGKRHLNFSEYTRLPIAVQNHKFEEVIESQEEKWMPMDSYTYLGLHAGAKLSDDQRGKIISWARANMDSLKAQYPADSLVLKRKKP